MKWKFLIIFIILLANLALILPIRAETATIDEARQIANNWITLIIDTKGDWGGSSQATVIDVYEFMDGKRTLGYFCEVSPKGFILVPIRKELAPVKAYSAENNIGDVLFVFIFGALGVTMERLGYNRPALLLGFVLGETIERYFQVSVDAYGGYLFFLRPISMTIIVLTLIFLIWPNRRRIALLWRKA